MIRLETNEKMDLEGHYPQNTISHCIISNETQITLHIFQGRIFAMPEIIVGNPNRKKMHIFGFVGTFEYIC